MKNPIGITPKQEIPVLLGIKQFVRVLPRQINNILLMKSKIDELQNIFTRITFKQCLLFTDSQSKTESYGNYLNKVGWKNEVINGAQDQCQRLDTLEKLIKFKCRILITTDLMARGIDIENINLIINLDLPYDCYTYLHRIGRAGRYGSHGIAITFVNGEEDLGKYQKMLGDIGGNSLKAMKYPDETVSYDFWNFQDENNNLDTVAGFSDNENDIEVIEATSTENSTKNEEIVMNNLAILEITRKLVDNEESKKNNEFDLNAILKDYEQNLQEPERNKDFKGVSSNIFLETIQNLQFYSSEESNKVNKSPSITVEDNRHVIFKRNEAEANAEDLSSESNASEDDISEDENESDKIQPETSYQKARLTQNFRDSCTSHISVKVKSNSKNPYNHYVSTNYSQWENIYYHQLANIHNYMEIVRK